VLCDTLAGVFGFTSRAIVAALGTSSRNSSNRFGPNAPAKKLTPVMLSSGRLRLLTSPRTTGSLPSRDSSRLRGRTVSSLCRAGTFFLMGSFVFRPPLNKERRMNGLIYLIGLIVVILAVLSFFGLR
jgi:hypothetical protein